MVNGCAVNDWVDVSNKGFAGARFTDGSCEKGPFRDCNRAGWSVVAINGQGQVTAEAYGPVAWDLPQLPGVAEWCAVAACAQLTKLCSISPDDLDPLHIDCEAVVKTLGKDWHAVARSKKAAGAYFVKECLKDVGLDGLGRIVKVKAHTTGSEGQDPLLTFGNERADELAKRGRRLHALDGEDELAKIAGLYFQVGRSMAKTLAIFSKLPMTTWIYLGLKHL